MRKCKNVNCTQRRIYGEKHRSGADGGKDFFFPLGIAGDPSLQNWGLAPIFQYFEQKILKRIMNRILNHLNIVFKNGSKHLDFVKKRTRKPDSRMMARKTWNSPERNSYLILLCQVCVLYVPCCIKHEFTFFFRWEREEILKGGKAFQPPGCMTMKGKVAAT